MYHFLQALFRESFSPDTFFEIRGITADGRAESHYYPLSDAGVIDATSEVLSALDEGNYFVGVLPRLRRHGADVDCYESRWLWVDIDAGKDGTAGVRTLIEAAGAKYPHLPNPTMAVASGSGGVHLYWKLREPVSLTETEGQAKFSKTLKRLCSVFGAVDGSAHADISCVNPSRILRVPETLNHKFATPPTTKVTFYPDPVPQSYAWWRGQLPPEPESVFSAYKRQSEGIYANSGDFVRGIPPGVFTRADEPYPEGERHKKLMSWGFFLAEKIKARGNDGFELMMRRAKASGGRHEVTQKEVSDIWEWVLKRAA